MNDYAKSVEAIETVVDAIGVRNTLQALAEVCFQKQIHVEENWQDGALAREWHSLMTRISNFADKLPYDPLARD